MKGLDVFHGFDSLVSRTVLGIIYRDDLFGMIYLHFSVRNYNRPLFICRKLVTFFTFWDRAAWYYFDIDTWSSAPPAAVPRACMSLFATFKHPSIHEITFIWCFFFLSKHVAIQYALLVLVEWCTSWSQQDAYRFSFGPSNNDYVGLPDTKHIHMMTAATGGTYRWWEFLENC